MSRRQALCTGGGAAAAGLVAVAGCGAVPAARASGGTVVAGRLSWRAQVAGRVVALHASTGARRWTSVALAGVPGLLLVTGRTLWSYQLGAGVADVTASGHVVYALDDHGGVYALRT